MKITNLNNLPASLVAAVEYSDRNREGCDYTVTELQEPPRILALKRKYKDELEEDASDRLWALLGSAGHEVLKRSAKKLGVGIVEERATCEVTVNGKSFKVGGQLDFAMTAEAEISDFKFTSVWAVKEGAKPEWTQQLNMYRWLCHQYGVKIEKLTIIAILRDWSVREAKRDPSYPQQQVKVFPLRLWSLEETETFIATRILVHEAAKAQLPLCTDDDTWAKPEKWAAKKKGAARATKLFDNKADCEEFAASNRLEVEHRPGEHPRCESYCVCSPFCSQFIDWQKAQ